MILKKGKLVIVSIVEAILICLLSVLLTFKTICVKTISDNYMNLTITNQIIDFVIDNYTNINNDQLKSLQNDLIDSKELYQFNEQAFDQTIYDIKTQNSFHIEDKTIDNFSKTCIKLIEKNLDRELSSQQQQDMRDLLEKDSLWSRFSQNIDGKINKNSFFVKMYSFSDMWSLKIVIVVFILLGIFFIYRNSKEYCVVYFLIITLLSSLLNYILLMIVSLLTPVLARLLNIESLTISMDLILYIAMTLLIVSLLLFIFGIMKKSYKK